MVAAGAPSLGRRLSIGLAVQGALAALLVSALVYATNAWLLRERQFDELQRKREVVRHALAETASSRNLLLTTGVPYWEAFGWLKKPFENLEELRRLKYRTSGLGLDMLRHMGMTGVQLPGGEVLPALERGTIDGAEWGIPSHDILMGFHHITKFYYMPDMRQPPAVHELIINKSKFDELPADLKAIVRHAAMSEITRMAAHSIDLDSKAAVELVEKHGVKILRTPDAVFKAQLEAMDKVFDAEAKKNPFFAKVLASQREFAKRAVPHAARIRPPLERAVEHYWSK